MERMAQRIHNWKQRREGNAEGFEEVTRAEFHLICDLLFERRI